MAALTSSSVTINSIWYDGRNKKLKVVDATLTLAGHGGLSNSIAASLFGLASILDVRSARDSNNKSVNARPSYDGTLLLTSPQNETVKTFTATGTNGAGNITVTGAATTDEVISVVDLTTPGGKTTSHYTITATNTVAQAAGAGDTSAKTLLFSLRSPAGGTAADITATVRLLVVGLE